MSSEERREAGVGGHPYPPLPVVRQRGLSDYWAPGDVGQQPLYGRVVVGHVHLIAGVGPGVGPNRHVGHPVQRTQRRSLAGEAVAHPGPGARHEED